jgi:hypothetical protein
MRRLYAPQEGLDAREPVFAWHLPTDHLLIEPLQPLVLWPMHGMQSCARHLDNLAAVCRLETRDCACKKERARTEKQGRLE